MCASWKFAYLHTHFSRGQPFDYRRIAMREERAGRRIQCRDFGYVGVRQFKIQDKDKGSVTTKNTNDSLLSPFGEARSPF
jgi:hypothetical protein